MRQGAFDPPHFLARVPPAVIFSLRDKGPSFSSSFLAAAGASGVSLTCEKMAGGGVGWDVGWGKMAGVSLTCGKRMRAAYIRLMEETCPNSLLGIIPISS